VSDSSSSDHCCPILLFYHNTSSSNNLSITTLLFTERLTFLSPLLSYSSILPQRLFLKQSLHHDSSFQWTAHLPQTPAVLFFYSTTAPLPQTNSLSRPFLSLSGSSSSDPCCPILLFYHNTSSSNNLSITTLPFTERHIFLRPLLSYSSILPQHLFLK
jgi:hypothetical protein